MDEQRLGELFRAAAVTCAVAVVGVGAVLAGALGPSGPSALAAAPAQSAQSAQSMEAAARPSAEPTTDALSDEATNPVRAPRQLAPMEAPAPTPPTGGFARSTGAPGAVGCLEPDRRVYAALAAELPAARGIIPGPVAGGCPPGGVGVTVTVTEGAASGGARGTLTAVLTPAGVPAAAPQDGPWSASAAAPARSGWQLRITAGSAGGPVPYRDRVGQLAHALADRL